MDANEEEDEDDIGDDDDDDDEEEEDEDEEYIDEDEEDAEDADEEPALTSLTAMTTLDAIAAGGRTSAGEGASFEYGALDIDGRAPNRDTGGPAAETDGPTDAKQRKKERKERERRALEHEARLREEMAGGAARVPESVAEFEELVAQRPESSYLWMRFMAFALGAGDISLSRKVAERALAAVPLEETDERFNLYIARLNLEKQHGDAASMRDVIAEACQRSDEKRVLVALFAIEEKHGDADGMRNAAARLTKRYGGSCKAWVRAYMAEFLAPRGAADASESAHALLGRAMNRLPSRKHVKFLSACAAYACSQPGSGLEAGRALYEKLIASYPRRLDVWLRYVDAEEKACASVPSDDARRRVRALYARIESMPLPVKKMRTVFQRELAFENKEEQGSRRAARVEDVRRRAMAWAEEHAQSAGAA